MSEGGVIVVCVGLAAGVLIVGTGIKEASRVRAAAADAGVTFTASRVAPILTQQLGLFQNHGDELAFLSMDGGFYLRGRDGGFFRVLEDSRVCPDALSPVRESALPRRPKWGVP